MEHIAMSWWIVAAAGFIFLATWFISLYNRLVRARHEVDNAQGQVEVQLQRRHDLVPNLVEIVRGYAGHEKETLENVTWARNQAAGRRPGEDSGFEAENTLTQALMDLKVVIEKYPELKADRSFGLLQEQLGDTEEKIARARQYYNDAVLRLRNLADQIPGSLVAPLAGLREAPPYFRSAGEAHEAPRVSFSSDRR